jgi:hypothetical protein
VCANVGAAKGGACLHHRLTKCLQTRQLVEFIDASEGEITKRGNPLAVDNERLQLRKFRQSVEQGIFSKAVRALWAGGVNDC